MNVADPFRRRFDALPPRTRRILRDLVGQRAQWDPRFTFRPPPSDPDLETGPPSFVGVGVQKAGTTWWFALIAAHPAVYVHPGVHKERHFFGRFWAREFTDSDSAEYHRWFPRTRGMVTGEWSPDYAIEPWMPPLLFASAPEAKLLFMVRDPVERYRSGLTHHYDLGDKLDARVATAAYYRGLYYEQLRRFERCFGADNVLVLQYEQCCRAPKERLAETFRFLGLDDSFVPAGLTERVNASAPKASVSERERAWLGELYSQDAQDLAKHRREVDLDLWENIRR
jgi:hypothetical protein